MRRRARVIAVSSLLCSVACVILLHVLRPDLPPTAHRLSEYANGSFGWLMTVAFLTLGSGMLVLGYAMDRRTMASRVLSLLAWLAGGGMLLAAIFKTAASPWSELVHSRATAAATVAIVLIAVASAVDRTAPAKRADPMNRSLTWAGVGLLPLSVLLHDTAWTGLGQRMLWLVLVSWLLLTSWTVGVDTRSGS